MKAMIFDLDGTLGETIPVCIEAFRQTFKPYLGVLSDEEIYSHFGASDEGLIRELIPESYDEGIAAYFRHYTELHDRMCPGPFEGIPEILDYLRHKGVFLAMVTGKGAKSAGISLEKFGLAEFFRDFEAGSVSGPCKPRGIRDIVRRNALNPDETVYVGDVPSDITAAREAGVGIFSAAWAETANSAKLAALQPDRLFASVDEFAAYLRGMFGG